VHLFKAFSAITSAALNGDCHTFKSRSTAIFTINGDLSIGGIETGGGLV
jgi:hypothetical protein